MKLTKFLILLTLIILLLLIHFRYINLNKEHFKMVSSYNNDKKKPFKNYRHKPCSYNLNTDFVIKDSDIIKISNKYQFNKKTIMKPSNNLITFPLDKKIYNYKKTKYKKIIDKDKFINKILNQINKNNIDEKNIKELENPKISIWKKDTLTKIPFDKLSIILDNLKEQFDKLLYSIIDKNEIHCLEPIKENCKTYIINPQIYKILQTENWYQFIFKFNYYIHDKVYAYTVLAKVFIHKTNNTVKVNKLKLMGLLHEQNLHFKNNNYSKNYIYDNNVRINSEPYSENNIKNDYMYNSNYQNIITDKKSQDDFLKLRETNHKKNNVKPYCINGTGFNKIECESDIDDLGRSKKKGIWDSKCIKDTECPFFGKNGNLNYSNKRGGCINGFCEMPLNVKQIGPTTYIDKPICHNCPVKKTKEDILKEDEELTCCNIQKNKNKPFEKLKSPDYAFINDLSERIKYKDELKKFGLKPISNKI